MRNFLLLAAAALLIPGASVAATIQGSGTQPFACTVVGNSSINLVSTGQNQLFATGSGTITQNGDTDYTISAVSVTGPDGNLQATIGATGNTLSLSATDAAGATQQVTGELSESTTYSVTISSSDGVLSAGSYTASADLTCSAAP